VIVMQSLLEILWIFVKVNLLSTSGPASVGLLYQETVGKLVTEGEFVQAVGFSSVLPGSDAIQLAMYIGYAAAGIPGGLVAMVGSILPPFLLILGAVTVLQRLRREVWLSSFVEGLAPAIAVLMVFTAWKIFERGGETGLLGWGIGLVSLVLMFLDAPARIVVIAAGLLGILLIQ
jgi:chromate transporter